MHARNHDVRADIIFSVAAGITSAAAADRFDDHPVTHFEIGNRRAGFLIDAAALMANDAGIGDIGMRTVQDMYIRTADPGRCDPDQHLGVVFDRRDFRFDQTHLIRCDNL